MFFKKKYYCYVLKSVQFQELLESINTRNSTVGVVQSKQDSKE
jgi:hypothetical protein